VEIIRIRHVRSSGVEEMHNFYRRVAMFGIFSSAINTATRTPGGAVPPRNERGGWYETRRQLKEELRRQLHLRGGSW
jgi:hypothetical protein